MMSSNHLHSEGRAQKEKGGGAVVREGFREFEGWRGKKHPSTHCGIERPLLV
jgi:hypothetical protein